MHTSPGCSRKCTTPGIIQPHRRLVSSVGEPFSSAAGSASTPPSTRSAVSSPTILCQKISCAEANVSGNCWPRRQGYAAMRGRRPLAGIAANLSSRGGARSSVPRGAGWPRTGNATSHEVRKPIKSKCGLREAKHFRPQCFQFKMQSWQAKQSRSFFSTSSIAGSLRNDLNCQRFPDVALRFTLQAGLPRV